MPVPTNLNMLFLSLIPCELIRPSNWIIFLLLPGSSQCHVPSSPISLSWHLLNLCCSRSFLCHVPPWLSPASAGRAQWAEWPCYKNHNITSLEPCTALHFTQPKRHIPYSGLQSPANKMLSSPSSSASLGPATQSLPDTWISMSFSIHLRDSPP